MRWLTASEIKHRSKTAKSALKVSHEHWTQLYTATAKELRDECERTNKSLSQASYCGLCAYHRQKQRDDYCAECILKDFYGLWREANAELTHWFYGYSDGDWHDWKRACKALRDKLKELMDEK